MALVLYNSLTRRKEPFTPLDPSNVRMYVCGPTVYDLAHIGNARAVVAFDVLYRALRHEYGAGHVRYVRNITDVEDKIIAAARDNGEPIEALTARTTAIFHEDMAALGNLPPDVEPRATEYIPQMIAMIERLIASGHAYAAQGHALFRVGSYDKYGALARRSRTDMIAGARVEVAPYKEDPGDFVLWKPSTPDLPGWDSPWGRGRPGWHIECSAMSETELGETFDIHGGGLDLIFPHHENEIAQSVCAHDGHSGPDDFARTWLHNGMLTVGGTKMAKSEGNFITVRDVLQGGDGREFEGEAVRFALLGTHYRDPLNWTQERLEQARNILSNFYLLLAKNVSLSELGYRSTLKIETPKNILSALEDDLNTPLAITQLHAYANAIRHAADDEELTRMQLALTAGGRLMGLLPRTWYDLPLPGFDADAISKELIEADIAERAEARRERRFADADRIRAVLAAKGVILEDKPDGTTEWRRG